jgi:type I restriction enzyme S subunit
VEKLSQSILVKAFRGELVPTEAELAEAEGRDFESADQLLKRVQKQKEASTSKAKNGRRVAPTVRRG